MQLAEFFGSLRRSVSMLIIAVVSWGGGFTDWQKKKLLFGPKVGHF